ncbi:MAG TPA: hypothetical protein VJ246_02750 [Patescibacteria group bacterium]|nr:hypothetical protein [Patescibacteria group bacterium]
MISMFHYLKLVQLALVAWWCTRYKPKASWVFILFSIPLLSMFIPGSYESGDFTTHIVRAMDLMSSLRYGVFPVRWAWLLHGGYGYPLFNFVSILPYYQLAIQKLVGIPFVSGMKLFLATWYLFSGFNMFLLGKRLWKNNHAAVISAVLYGFAPYMLINLNFRAAVGELGGFALLPLILYAVLGSQSLLFTISTSLLFIMHPGVTLLGMPFVVLLILLKKKVRVFLFPIVLSIGLTAWYLIPAIMEAQFTEQVYHATQNYWGSSVFPPLLQLFWSPWRVGFLFQGHYGELAYTLGYFAWIAVFASIVLLWKKRIEKRYIRPVFFLLVAFSLGFFMVTPFSAWVWNVVPMIRKLQFPSRMMLLTVTSSSLLAGYVFRRILKTQWIPIFLCVAVGWTTLNWTHRTYKPEVDDGFLQTHLPYVSFEYERLPEAIPKWKKDIATPRTESITVVYGDAIYQPVDVRPTTRSYIIDVTSSNSTLIENTMYFPGWKLTIDGVDSDVTISERGLMQFSLPQGKHTIAFVFEDTPVRKISNAVTLVSIVILGLWIHRKRNT